KATTPPIGWRRSNATAPAMLRSTSAYVPWGGGRCVCGSPPFALTRRASPTTLNRRSVRLRVLLHIPIPARLAVAQEIHPPAADRLLATFRVAGCNVAVVVGEAVRLGPREAAAPTRLGWVVQIAYSRDPRRQQIEHRRRVAFLERVRGRGRQRK